MNELWNELRETIIELRDNNGTCTQQEICRFLVNLMDVLEKQMQQSCDNSISRQSVLDYIHRILNQGTGKKKSFEFIQKYVEKLPSVKPQEPKTVLYSGDGYADGYMVYDMAKCPNCGYEYEDGDKDWGLSFCPNCGQKLNWESEVRNG